MASSYSNNLKIELMTTGEKATTWGTVTNTNLGTALEEAIVGTADVTFSSADLSITLTNSNSTQPARHVRLNLTGTTGGTDRTLTVPDIEKTYIVNNGCADAVAISNSTGSTVSVPAGKTMWVYSTGSNVVDVTTHLTSLTVGATPSNVVTESATQTLTNKTITSLAGSLASAVTAVTQSSGDNSTKVATTAYVEQEISTEHVDTAQLVNDAVTSAKIADNAVNSEHYVDGSIDRVHLAADVIDSTKLANDAVGSEHIQDNINLPGSPTTTTQSVSNRSTRIATTDFVRDAIETYAEVELTSSSAQASASSDSISVVYGPTGKALVLAAAGRKADFGNQGGVSYTLQRGSTTVRSESGQVIEYADRDSDSTFVFFYTQTGKTAGSSETWTVSSSGAGSATYATIAYIGF